MKGTSSDVTETGQSTAELKWLVARVEQLTADMKQMKRQMQMMAILLQSRGYQTTANPEPQLQPINREPSLPVFYQATPTPLVMTPQRYQERDKASVGIRVTGNKVEVRMLTVTSKHG
uniref:Uncharacterized protein n=4 Tax=Picea TaxID=3328 RepID=A0A101LV61_PICGL|nr:hypothetical protein ABT39_MTgene2047 [Picea glauca]QHR92811.1 hypothetical protein Q903MT_gene6859 [Picea sitchensis]